MTTVIKLVHRIEDALLVILLIIMILLSSSQILLRNFFDIGFIWIDPFLRVLVLWLGLIGATVATRENRHVRIDLFSRVFSRNTHRLIQSIVGLFCTLVCLLIAYYGMTWIQLDFDEGVKGMAGVPAWMLEIIVPASFALIGIRYLAMSVCWIRLYYKHLLADPDSG